MKNITDSQMNEFWDSLNESKIDYLNIHFKNEASKFLEFLIASLFNHAEIQIGLFTDGSKRGSCVTYDIYGTWKKLNLNYIQDDYLEVELNLLDWDDELVVYRYKLNSDEIKIIPQGLINLLKEACVKNREIIVSANKLNE